MTLAYGFHPLAAGELDAAVAYYAALRPGKRLELLRQMQSVIAQIRELPESAPITLGAIRSMVVQPSARWNYTLHYRVKPSGIRILAVAHQKRQPFYWLTRR